MSPNAAITIFADFPAIRAWLRRVEQSAGFVGIWNGAGKQLGSSPGVAADA